MDEAHNTNDPTPAPSGGKRVLFISLSLGLGLGVALAAIDGIIVWYRNRPTPPKTWNESDFQAKGIRASLRTEWRDGKLKYQFRVRPYDQSLVTAFDKLARPAAVWGSFTITLNDKSGFEICKITVLELIPRIGSDGVVASIGGNGEDFLCTRSQYLESASWSLTSHFPKVAASTLDDAGKSRSDVPRWKDKSRWLRIQKGMTQSQVEDLLGHPGEVQHYEFLGEEWYYPNKVNGGQVDFNTQGRVNGWKNP